MKQVNHSNAVGVVVSKTDESASGIKESVGLKVEAVESKREEPH